MGESVCERISGVFAVWTRGNNVPSLASLVQAWHDRATTLHTIEHALKTTFLFVPRIIQHKPVNNVWPLAAVNIEETSAP